jgi:hypothetical protein
MTATNNTKDELKLLLLSFLVIDDLGNQYEADPFDSTFPEAVARGATVSGHAKMRGPLKDGATALKVMFKSVFGSWSIDYIVVDNVAIR